MSDILYLTNQNNRCDNCLKLGGITMSQHYRILMQTETENEEIIELKKEIDELLYSPSGMLSDKELTAKNELWLAKVDKLEEMLNEESEV